MFAVLQGVACHPFFPGSKVVEKYTSTRQLCTARRDQTRPSQLRPALTSFGGALAHTHLADGVCHNTAVAAAPPLAVCRWTKHQEW